MQSQKKYNYNATLKSLKMGLKGNALGAMFLALTWAINVTTGVEEWLIFLNIFLVIYLLFLVMRILSRTPQIQPTEQIAIPTIISELMDVTESTQQNHNYIFSGALKKAPQLVREALSNAFKDKAIPLLQETWSGQQIILIPGRIEDFVRQYTPRPFLHLTLGIITVITTTLAGAYHLGFNGLTSWEAVQAGLSYSIPLLSILGLHESGHFILARYHGMSVTPPFFIPLPFGLGTLGALIQVRSPATDRESLFDMAVAGPLAGFITSIPILILGLKNSTIIHPSTPHIFMTGTFWDQTPVSGSILLSLLANIACGGAVHYGDLLKLSPLALAGWIGMWVTAFNLLPIGQLDGGHISQAMFGSKWSVVLTRLAMGILLFLAVFVWPGFLVWLLLLYFIARQTVPPLDDITPITKWRLFLGWFAMALIPLIFCPMAKL